MTAHAAVRVHDDLAPREARVAHRSADHEPPRRIDVVLRVLVQQFRRQHGLDHVLQNVRAQLVNGDRLGVLGGDNDSVDAHWLVVGVVLHRHLALAVGPQVRQLAVLANLREPPRQLVRQRDWGRHELRRFVGRVAEHHALVAGPAGIHAHGNVARLLVDGRNHRAGVRVESVNGVVVSDRGHNAAHQRLEIDVRARRDFAGDHHQPGRGQRLARHTAVRILLEAGVKNSVGNLVGDLIGMTFGHGFRGKEKAFSCGQ